MQELELSEEQIDYLREMMNIGSGNAASALSKVLKTGIDSHVPEIHLCPLVQVPSVIGDPTDLVAGVRLRLQGDVMGYLFFMLPGDNQRHFMALAHQAMPGVAAGEDAPVLLEVARIIAGSFLNALRNFCGLSITQAPPYIATDMLQAIMDEAIASVGDQMVKVLLIKNQLVAVDKCINTFILIVPDRASTEKMVNSIEQARRQFGIAPS